MFKSFKKVISTLAAVAILATSASAFAVTFPDVDEAAAYAPSVDILTSLGIVEGDDNGKFNPDNTVTRAEFTKMVVEAIGEGNAAASSTWTKFTDSQSHWAAGYIETGVSNGFINGYDDFNFGPDDQVTYEQAVKMLVAAIGYTSYAEMAGGYPGGYLSYGSSLKIINGVNGVTNTTALTRAQCAVLIANTLKAPICTVVGSVPNYSTGEMVPEWKPQNGKNDQEYLTLLTEKHNAYDVKGRVSSVDDNKAEGLFKIEVAENFDDYKYAGGNKLTSAGNVMVDSSNNPVSTDTSVNFVATEAADMLFQYADAIIQLDPETDEWNLIAITSYGAVKTVEFASEDIDDIDETTKMLTVKRDGSNKTDDYDLNTNTAGSEIQVEVFVNGASQGMTYAKTTVPFDNYNPVTDQYLGERNVRGTVTLVNTTNVASTQTDRDYDIIMVDYYEVGKVDSVKIKDDSVKINSSGPDVAWDLDDEDMNIKFYKDDAEISYEDIKENDVILVAAKGTLSSAKWIEVYVTDATVAGVPTSQKDEDVTVDGTVYTVDLNAPDVSAMPALGTNYTFFVDAMGYVVGMEEGVTENQNFGVVSYLDTVRGSSGDYEVSIITKDGEVEYRVTDATTKTDLLALVGGTLGNASKLSRDTDVATRTIKFRITNEKLKMIGSAITPDNMPTTSPAPTGAPTIEYKESTSKLGNYTVDETVTTIIDLDAYLDTTVNGDAAVYAYENLEDENEYKGYVFDRNSKGVYNFVVLTGNTTSIRPTSSLAVVMESGSSTTTEDGTPVNVITVAKDGAEDVEVMLEDGITAPAEGTIIMYTVGSEGYVTSGNLYTVYAPAAGYDTMMNAILAETTFTEAATDRDVADAVVANASAESGYTIGVGTVNTEVSVYYGPVYRATSDVLELFVSKSSGSSNVNTAVESFTLSGANVYTFNYDANTGDGVSVSVDKVAQNMNIFKGLYTDATNSDVLWSAVSADYTECAPAAAFVREVDGDVTDVVYFIAE